MDLEITPHQLTPFALNQKKAKELVEKINTSLKSYSSAEEAWQFISKKILSKEYAFEIHLLIFSLLFPQWREQPETAPAWIPEKNFISHTNIFQFMHALGFDDVRKFHAFTTEQFSPFWECMIEELKIVFSKPPLAICDLTKGIENCSWFPGGMMNIVDSCFSAPANETAIIYQQADKTLHTLSYAALMNKVNQVANSLIHHGFVAGDTIAIIMSMNVDTVAIYLGIIKMGGVVVSIADSFSNAEIITRLNIAQAKAIFTQDFSVWGEKKIPLYEKLTQTTAKVIMLTCDETRTMNLRVNDMHWEQFLSDKTDFKAVPCHPMQACHILFSSGTTAEPKAIVWNHTTPIKVASDAYFHQNIQAGDVLAWPTNLGWMMGPWLIFAALMSHASIALCAEIPKERSFGEFIQNAKVTMLGVVPTLVASWRQTHCMEQLDWRAIKAFSSTGECSNPEDMLYLMSLAHYQPVIEYCGGTEIGGAYISSTMIENNYPSLFSTPTMGLNIVILNEEGQSASVGEVAIVPPSIGLSTTLLNANHYQIYFANMPTTQDGKILRRHGDQIKRYANGYYSILGRIDDTMNLGGIKISAAEIERTLTGMPAIKEIAAIAIAPHNGPSQLIIYAVTHAHLDKQTVMREMQKKINTFLNPLFKIHDVIFINELPRTASNKIMRRTLRKTYETVK
ncbi:MAG: AMP-binding protein [Gammaproteobacteria bacterium]|nr:AMP-binding protein [Gammaproteobacteria bacterium]